MILIASTLLAATIAQIFNSYLKGSLARFLLRVSWGGPEAAIVELGYLNIWDLSPSRSIDKETTGDIDAAFRENLAEILSGANTRPLSDSLFVDHNGFVVRRAGCRLRGVYTRIIQSRTLSGWFTEFWGRGCAAEQYEQISSCGRGRCERLAGPQRNFDNRHLCHEHDRITGDYTSRSDTDGEQFKGGSWGATIRDAFKSVLIEQCVLLISPSEVATGLLAKTSDRLADFVLGS